MWLPNVFLLVSCVYLFRRVANEQPLPLSPEGPFRRRLADRFFSRRDRHSGPGRDGRVELARARPGGRRTEAPPDLPAPEHETAESPGTAYVGNIRLERFHRSECHCLQRLSPQNRRGFETREEAVDAGYEPCRVCKP
jgi:hypothetical protein